MVLQLKAIGGGGFMRDVTKPDGNAGKVCTQSKGVGQSRPEERAGSSYAG